METKVTQKEIDELMEELKSAAEMAGKGMGENYKQKLIYSLLNTLKAGDYGEFMWLLLRAINKPEYWNMGISLKKAISLPSETFQKWGYSVVIGLMSSGIADENISKEGEENE